MGKEDRHKMILPVVSSLLLASMAFAAPGANYGAAAHVSPAKQISSPSIQCRTEYVTLWDTEYQEHDRIQTGLPIRVEGSWQRQGVGSHRGNLPERSLRRVQGRGEDPRQAGRLPGVQRRPRAEVRVRPQADLRHRPRPDLQDRASDRVPGRAPPTVPL